VGERGLHGAVRAVVADLLRDRAERCECGPLWATAQADARYSELAELAHAEGAGPGQDVDRVVQLARQLANGIRVTQAEGKRQSAPASR